MAYAGHLIRVGCMGHVGRFSANDGVRYARKARVICRTVRGLEVGEVLAAWDGSEHAADGQLLRGVTVQDELLIQRIVRRRDEAFEACESLLAGRGVEATLVDVEHLFDGQSLFFYFLGETTEELASLTGELAEAYETKVQFRKFTETLTEGCGPDCGTQDECGSCSSCAIAGACASRPG